VIATGFDPKKLEPQPEPQRPSRRPQFEPPALDPFFLSNIPAAEAKPAPAAGAAPAPVAPLSSVQTIPLPRTISEADDDPFASTYPAATDVDKDHDTVIGMLVDKFQRERERGKRSEF